MSAIISLGARGGGEKLILAGNRVRTSAGFEGVSAKSKDISGEAGLEELSFVGRHS